MQVMGAYFEKVGSKSFAVYSIAVRDAENRTWFVKRRFFLPHVMILKLLLHYVYVCSLWFYSNCLLLIAKKVVKFQAHHCSIRSCFSFRFDCSFDIIFYRLQI